MYKIGFIGLGIMGKPMARNLLKAGYSLVVYDINEEAVEEVVKDGAARGKSSCDVASKSDVVITMLPNSPDVKEVIIGDKGVIYGVKPGSVVIDMSSIAPSASRELAEILLKKEVIMLDAPVSGGEPKAIEGTLAIMVGGPEATFNKVKDIFDKMGTSVKLVGDIGSGNITKLANQIIVALNIAAIGEAMVLATKAGADPEKVYQAIKGGLAGSAALEAKMPMILNGNFKPGFRIELHIKDLKNALDTARELGVKNVLTVKVLEIMEELKADGKAKDDHGGIIRFYEKSANVEVRKKQ
ncbi:MAG: 2-hydroxy-3-oxopropionate reductase [Bacteroidetes bacterium RBG_13_43_22]|nr:MAG: 2-hydroxy-3-oxopropionate reductase [Bacteroidetes bacterium RBG_13_43_22]